MKGIIRIADKKDTDAIVRLFNSNSILWGNNRDNYINSDIENYMEHKVNKIIVYEFNNSVVGALLAQFWKRYIYLHTIVVDEKYRGRGIGKELLAHLENQAGKKKIGLIEMDVDRNNAAMISLLEKKGYERGKEFIFYSKEIK